MSKFVKKVSYDGTVLGGNVTSVTPLISNLVLANDQLVVQVVSSRNNLDSITESTSLGYVSMSEESNASRGTSRVFAKITTGSETNPTFGISGVATDMLWTTLVFEGIKVDVSVADAVIAQTTAASFANVVTFPTVDTTGFDNALIIYVIRTELRDRNWLFSNNIVQETNDTNDSSGSSECISTGWYVQQTGGTTLADVKARMSGVGDDYTLHVIALKNDGNGNIKGMQDPASAPADLVHALFMSSGSFYSGELQDGAELSNDPSTIISNLDDPSTGVATIKQAVSGIGSTRFTPVNKSFPAYAGFNASSSSHWDDANINGTKLASTQDFRNSLFSVLLFTNNTAAYSWSNDGAYWVGLLNGNLTDGAAATFRLAAKDTVLSPVDGIFPYVFDTTTASNYQTHTGGTGALNLELVDRIAIASIVTAGNQSAFGLLHKLNSFALVGGSTGDPANFLDIVNHTKKCGLRTVQNQSGQTTSQFYVTQSIQVGNGGTNTTNFDFSGQSIEFPAALDSDAGFVHANIDEAAIGIDFYPGASDVGLTSGFTSNGGNFMTFTFNASYNTSASVDFTGSLIINHTVTLIDIGSAIGGMTFIGCKSLDLNGADMSGGNIVSQCLDANSMLPLVGATQAALQLLLDDIANWTFTSNLVAIRIEYTGTGDISLNFDGITWTSNTTDIHYDSTNESTLTANMQNGANASTSVVSGAAVAVNISNDITATINVNVAGVEIRILSPSGSTTSIFNVETATTSEAYIYTYSSDFTGDINVFKPGYKDVWIPANAFSDSNQTITVELEEQPGSQN